MLAPFRRFVLVNNSGQDLVYSADSRIVVKETAWIVTPSTGKLAYTALADDDLGFTTGTLSNGAEIVGDVEVDNTSNLYVGSLVQFEIKHGAGAAASGTFDLYISEGLATGELPTDENGYVSAEANCLQFVGSLVWEDTASDDDIQTSSVFAI